MSPDDRWRLLHIVEAIEQAQAFVNRRARSDLEHDVMLRPRWYNWCKSWARQRRA